MIILFYIGFISSEWGFSSAYGAFLYRITPPVRQDNLCQIYKAFLGNAKHFSNFNV